MTIYQWLHQQSDNRLSEPLTRRQQERRKKKKTASDDNARNEVLPYLSLPRSSASLYVIMQIVIMNFEWIDIQVQDTAMKPNRDDNICKMHNDSQEDNSSKASDEAFHRFFSVLLLFSSFSSSHLLAEPPPSSPPRTERHKTEKSREATIIKWMMIFNEAFSFSFRFLFVCL